MGISRLNMSCIAIAVAGLSVSTARAVQVDWNGQFSTDWIEPLNWTPFGTPGTSDTAAFGYVGIANGHNVDLSIFRTVLEFKVKNDAGNMPFTFSRSNSAILNVTGSALFDSSSVNYPVNLDSFSLSCLGDVTAQHSTLVVLYNNAHIGCANLLVKESATVFISAGNVNPSNDITLDGGTLILTASSTLSLATGRTVYVKNGGALTLVPSWNLPNNGTFDIQSGGKVTANSYSDIALGAGLTATLNVSGTGSEFRTTTVNGNTTNWGEGAGAIATVNISNQGLASAKILEIGLINATANVSLSTGGKITANVLTMGDSSASSASALVTLSSNSAVAVQSAAVRQGATIRLDGTSDLAGILSVTGELALTNNGSVVCLGTRQSLISLGSLTMADTSKIDFARGTDFSVGLTKTAIRALIATGYNGGNWGGNRLTSSFAAANASYGLYYGDAGSNVAVKVSLSGDTNGDRTVNFADLLKLAQNYGTSSRYWADGDFNYDGIVNFPDLLKLAQNYGVTATGIYSSDFALATAPSPEPGLAAFIATLLPITRRRRR